MVNEIVFHLGDCKTGTTSIQSALAAQAWTSQAGDITYPTRLNHIPLARTLSMPREKRFEEARFTKLREAFQASDAAHGVVSAEHFEFVDPEAVHAAILRHLPDWAGNIRLVAYVRPHGDRLVSTFAERSKKGLFLQSPEAMHEQLIKNRLLFYTPRFKKWRATFGNAFTLRPFVRNRLYKEDVVQDFFRYLLGSEAFDITQPTARNESLSVEDIAMLRAIHQYIRKETNSYHLPQQAFGWYMSDLLAATPHASHTKPRLHKALAQQVVQTYAEDAAALDAEFFDGTPMSDALAATPDKAIKVAQSFRPEDHYDASELRRFRVWAQLLLRMMQANPGHFNWSIRPEDQRMPRRTPSDADKNKNPA